MNQIDLETPAISALAAVSKTPFLTALKVTLGIALGRLLMFILVIGIIAGTVKLLLF